MSWEAAYDRWRDAGYFDDIDSVERLNEAVLGATVVGEAYRGNRMDEMGVIDTVLNRSMDPGYASVRSMNPADVALRENQFSAWGGATRYGKPRERSIAEDNLAEMTELVDAYMERRQPVGVSTRNVETFTRAVKDAGAAIRGERPSMIESRTNYRVAPENIRTGYYTSTTDAYFKGLEAKGVRSLGTHAYSNLSDEAARRVGAMPSTIGGIRLSSTYGPMEQRLIDSALAAYDPQTQTFTNFAPIGASFMDSTLAGVTPEAYAAVPAPGGLLGDQAVGTGSIGMSGLGSFGIGTPSVGSFSPQAPSMQDLGISPIGPGFAPRSDTGFGLIGSAIADDNVPQTAPGTGMLGTGSIGGFSSVGAFGAGISPDYAPGRLNSQARAAEDASMNALASMTRDAAMPATALGAYNASAANAPDVDYGIGIGPDMDPSIGASMLDGTYGTNYGAGWAASARAANDDVGTVAPSDNYGAGWAASARSANDIGNTAPQGVSPAQAESVSLGYGAPGPGTVGMSGLGSYGVGTPGVGAISPESNALSPEAERAAIAEINAATAGTLADAEAAFGAVLGSEAAPMTVGEFERRQREAQAAPQATAPQATAPQATAPAAPSVAAPSPPTVGTPSVGTATVAAPARAASVGMTGAGPTQRSAETSSMAAYNAAVNQAMGWTNPTAGVARSVGESVVAAGLGAPQEGYNYGYSPFGMGVSQVHQSAPESVQIAASGPGLLGAFRDQFGSINVGTPSVSGITGFFGGLLGGGGGGSGFSEQGVMGGSSMNGVENSFGDTGWTGGWGDSWGGGWGADSDRDVESDRDSL